MDYDLNRGDLVAYPDTEKLYDLQALPKDELFSMCDRFCALLKPNLVGGTESSVSHGCPLSGAPSSALVG